MRRAEHHPQPIAAVLALIAVLGGAIVLALAPCARAAQPLTLGFGDGVFAEAPAVADPWFHRAAESSARVVRSDLGWGGLSPTRPAHPADPSDPAYQWAPLDALARAARAHGVEPVIVLSGAPGWAEGAGRPASAAPGTWRPDPVAFEQFARALGRRYSGSYPDPASPGATLGRITYWQPFNEPNLSLYLTPQWIRSGRGFVPASPAIYRGLLNGFYRGVKSTSPTAVVVSAGTAPFGDPQPGGSRMAPALFVREMLCLHGARLALERCPDPVHLDVLAHHPYSVGGPFQSALEPDDVSIPDLARLTRPLRRAQATGRVLPRGHKRVWVTEVSYDSSPPDPQGVPRRRHARWTEETLFELWRQGVDTVVWFLIRDQPPVPDYGSSYQSGMYLLDGTPKLSQLAFRFPFVVEPVARGRSVAWTRVPAPGRLLVQRRRGGGPWQTVFSQTARAGEVVQRGVGGGRGGVRWRALIAGQSSLVWPP